MYPATVVAPAHHNRSVRLHLLLPSFAIMIRHKGCEVV